MNQSDVIGEVRQIILANRSTRLESEWLIQAVMLLHPDIVGDDEPFYRLCAREHIRDTVRDVLREYNKIDRVPEQLILEGMDRVQTHYLIESNKRSVLVPIEQMSDDELRAKIAEYRRIGRGCFEHAAELERWLSRRPQSAA